MSQAITMPLPADPLGAAARQVEQGHRRVLLTLDGKPVAAVVSVEDLAALERLDAAEDGFWTAEAQTALARWESEGRPVGTSHEELLARHDHEGERPVPPPRRGLAGGLCPAG